jgi:CRP/FNR family transcriptional regulator, cyclic AMP receptor protein
MQDTHIELLQSMPVFGAISEPSLQLLLDHSRLVELPAGQFFFREGEAASSMFVLETGRVALLKAWQGQEHLLHALAEGDCFGEMALMDLCPRSASVRADTDCRALEISAAALLALFERDAEQFALIQMNMGREVCRRLRATDEALFRARMGEPGAASPLFRAA